MYVNNADFQNEILLSVMIYACLHCYLYGPRYTVYISFYYSMENNQLAKYAKSNIISYAESRQERKTGNKFMLCRNSFWRTDKVLYSEICRVKQNCNSRILFAIGIDIS